MFGRDAFNLQGRGCLEDSTTQGLSQPTQRRDAASKLGWPSWAREGSIQATPLGQYRLPSKLLEDSAPASKAPEACTVLCAWPQPSQAGSREDSGPDVLRNPVPLQGTVFKPPQTSLRCSTGVSLPLVSRAWQSQAWT